MTMSNEVNGSIRRPLNAGDLLSRVLGELNAHIGAVWAAENGQLAPILAIGLDDTGLFDGPEEKKFLQRIVSDTLTQGRSQTFDTEGLIEPREFGHATLFLVPLLIPNVQPGVILVAERPNLPQQQRLGLMRHIESRCQEFSRHVALSTGAVPSAPSTKSIQPDIELVSPQNAVGVRQSVDPKAVLEYVLSLQRSLDLKEVANVVVNDGRILFAVDRVSLAVMRGRKPVIKAVSGQESVHPRGNLIRAMRRLTQKVVTTGETFRFDGTLNTVPKQLEEPLADFVQEAGTRFLLIVPLREPERLVKPEEPLGGGKPRHVVRKVIGALIIEQMATSQPSPELKSVLDSVTDHVAAATFNARSHSSIFLLPLWRTCGRFFEWLRGGRLAMAVAILLLIGAAVTALVVVPWPYRVDATGLLMPVIQREVFAPEDGQVETLLVQGGEEVNEGDELIILVNHELNAEQVKVQNELQEKKKLLNSLKAQENEAEKQNKTDERLRAQGKRVETQVEIDGAALQLETLMERRKRLVVRAPIKGRVTTFQVQQLLLNRPVKRGEVLLQVMDEQGEWHLELEIAEHRVGRVLKAQRALSPQLPIEYRLLTSPESSYKATLETLATRTVTAEEQGSVLEAQAKLDKSNLPQMAIGAEVRARIGCGESFLGDVLFGDVIEFVQKYLWW